MSSNIHDHNCPATKEKEKLKECGMFMSKDSTSENEFLKKIETMRNTKTIKSIKADKNLMGLGEQLDSLGRSTRHIRQKLTKAVLVLNKVRKKCDDKKY